MFRFLILLVVMLCPSVSEAQTPSAELRLNNLQASPGLPVVSRVFLNHTLDCEAFSFGVTHDPSQLTLMNQSMCHRLRDFLKQIWKCLLQKMKERPGLSKKH